PTDWREPAPGVPVPRPLPASVVAATGGDADAVRALILDATRRLIEVRGLAAASTRAIAEEVGVSGGTLYNYFANQAELVAKAVVQNTRDLTGPVLDLPARAGRSTVSANLAYFVRQATGVLDRLVPALAAT